ncbi:hypothetical protein CHARACLAT_005966 [Characodon lateralis]|uniref:Uncharacterized protein n=1 Tax=Characodon lateralis TaxID=208331 RepID=A0ABU7DQP0_9TELE|nr:hypothetical protein [Characodon lateralis]
MKLTDQCSSKLSSIKRVSSPAPDDSTGDEKIDTPLENIPVVKVSVNVCNMKRKQMQFKTPFQTKPSSDLTVLPSFSNRPSNNLDTVLSQFLYNMRAKGLHLSVYKMRSGMKSLKGQLWYSAFSVHISVGRFLLGGFMFQAALKARQPGNLLQDWCSLLSLKGVMSCRGLLS